MKKRRKKVDPGPELPMKAARPAWQPSVFRRSDRSNRLYARVKNANGKIVIRSTGQSTRAGAEQKLALIASQLGTQPTPTTEATPPPTTPELPGLSFPNSQTQNP
jgi:hypothetical protein